MNNHNLPQDIQDLTYEQAFAELERIVRELESEQASLESTLALFERGQQLVQRCTALLEQAELRLQVLSESAIPGSPEGESPDE